MVSREVHEYSTPVPHLSLRDVLLEHKSKRSGSQISLSDEYYSVSNFDKQTTTSNPLISGQPSEEPIKTHQKGTPTVSDDEETKILYCGENKDESIKGQSSKYDQLKDVPTNELKDINKGKCGPHTPIEGFKLKRVDPMPDDSDFLKPTVPSLLITVETLQSKISSKDQLIQCLADQLIFLAESGCCWKNSLLDCIASYPIKRCVDFDCAMLVDYLTGYIYFRPFDLIEASQTESHPLNLKVIGATTFDSLLLSWKISSDCEVCGFDIYVDDELVERIRDSEARRTLIHPINLQEENLITVCALDKCGIHLLCDIICIPPVTVSQKVLPELAKQPQETELGQDNS